MRIAVAGATGTVGRFVVRSAHGAGHEVVALSRSSGVDLTTGSGLATRLQGVDAVIDVSNVGALRRSAAVAFFETVTRTLLDAEWEAGVRHHVALSIVGIDRVPTGYYAGKLRQEELLAESGNRSTVLRATQFHEFPGQIASRIRGPVVLMPRMRSATVAASDVADQLVLLAAADPQGRAPDIAGPEVCGHAGVGAPALCGARGPGASWCRCRFRAGPAVPCAATACCRRHRASSDVRPSSSGCSRPENTREGRVPRLCTVAAIRMRGASSPGSASAPTGPA